LLAVEQAEGNYTEAAARLGIDRRTVRAVAEAAGVCPPKGERRRGARGAGAEVGRRTSEVLDRAADHEDSGCRCAAIRELWAAKRGLDRPAERGTHLRPGLLRGLPLRGLRPRGRRPRALLHRSLLRRGPPARPEGGLVEAAEPPVGLRHAVPLVLI